MAEPTPGQPSPRKPDGLIPAEWPAQAADTIVDTIAKVRDKTTKPALTIARGLVYGLLAAIGAVVGIVLLLVFVGRVYNNYSPIGAWLFYAVISTILLVGGVVLLRMATKIPAPKA